MIEESSSQQLGLGEIAKKGEEWYDKKLKAELEPTHKGRFVAIEVSTGEYVLANTPESALEQAREKYPGKFFHLMRVGYPGVFGSGGAD